MRRSTTSQIHGTRSTLGRRIYQPAVADKRRTRPRLANIPITESEAIKSSDRIIRLGFVPINGYKVPRTAIGRHPYPPRLEVLIREDLKLGRLNENSQAIFQCGLIYWYSSRVVRGKRKSLRDRWKLDIRIGMISEMMEKATKCCLLSMIWRQGYLNGYKNAIDVTLYDIEEFRRIVRNIR